MRQADIVAADIVLVDTEEHLALLPVRQGRAGMVILSGGSEAYHRVTPCTDEEPLRFVFCGLYIPLHGATVIARAISLLGPRVDVRFSMIGQGPERALTEATVGADDRVRWVDWLPRGDARPLADLILKLAQNPDEVAEARRRTRKLAEGFTPFMTTSALHDRLSKLHSETIASPELYLYQITSRSRAMPVSSRSGSSPESARVHSRQCHEMQGSLRKCLSTVPGAS